MIGYSVLARRADCPKTSDQLAPRRLALACPFLRKSLRSPLGSFLAAITSFPPAMLLAFILCTIVSQDRLARFSLSLGSEIRTVISGVCVLVCGLCVCGGRVAATRSAHDFWIGGDGGGVRIPFLRD